MLKRVGTSRYRAFSADDRRRSQRTIHTYGRRNSLLWGLEKRAMTVPSCTAHLTAINMKHSTQYTPHLCRTPKQTIDTTMLHSTNSTAHSKTTTKRQKPLKHVLWLGRKRKMHRFSREHRTESVGAHSNPQQTKQIQDGNSYVMFTHQFAPVHRTSATTNTETQANTYKVL